jgi:hypothetical protein
MKQKITDAVYSVRKLRQKGHSYKNLEEMPLSVSTMNLQSTFVKSRTQAQKASQRALELSSALPFEYKCY